MNLFKLSAKTLAILGLLIFNNLVIASPLNITSADPSDDPSDEPSGKPDNPQDNLYYRCDPGRGRGQFSPNYYSEQPWPDRGRGKIDSTYHGLDNAVYFDQSRDIKKTNAIDLQYCLNDMYHGIYEEEPGITNEEHHRRSRKGGYRTEGWYCRGNFFELGYKGLLGIWPAWKTVEACRHEVTKAAIAGRPWVSCQVRSHPFSKMWFGWSPAHCKMRYRKDPECYFYGVGEVQIEGNPKYESCMHPPCPEMCPKGVGTEPTSQPASQPTPQPTSSAKQHAAPTSKPTSKPAPESEDPKPTSEPGGQKTALEPVFPR